jgi:hypothetical protein
MNERQSENPAAAPRQYRWPRYVLAFVVLFLVSTVIWVWLAVRKIERERDVTAPLPTSAPLR